MRDHVLERAISFGDIGALNLPRLYRNWKARKAVGRLRDLDAHMLEDIGVAREEIEWAAGLPLTMNAALALEERSWARRKGWRR
jgi:uncharacterized protein YjiS (DUF1127 family)